MKDKIIYFILGILFSSITVYATSAFTAREISYSPEDETWQVENVQEAINELKTTCSSAVIPGNTNVYYIGDGTSFDIKTKFPDIDYTQLTKDNFIVELNDSYDYHERQRSPDDYYWWGKKIYLNKSYNASTGVLSAFVYAAAYKDSSLVYAHNHKVKAYLVLGEIG